MDAETAAVLVKDLRAVYATGKTRAFQWRVSQLEALTNMITRHEAEIIEALRLDLNKPEYEAYLHEIYGVVSSGNYALKNLHQWMRPEKVKTSMATFPSSAMIVPEPLGVVLVISTWNCPFLVSLDPIVGAIAAGNVVVLKPSEVTPATSSLLLKLLGEYMDTSAVKVIEGDASQTTVLLEQKWDKIFYTGSSKVGRIVMAAAAKHLTPVVLELGGKSPVVVDPNINLEVDALSFELEKFYGDDPLQSNDLSNIINLCHFDRLTKLLDDEKIAGRVVLGGQRDRAKLKIAPTVILDSPQDSLIMNEEIFGPLLPIITVNQLEDCISLINSKEKPLAAYLFTNNDKLKGEFIRSVSAGGMTINDTTLHVLECTLPFGGLGESGMGAYHGKFSFDAFSHRKSVFLRGFKGDVSARYPPYNPKNLKFLKALLSGNIFHILPALIGW